jgi:predicted DNA-binding transcriptional regulator AlpA
MQEEVYLSERRAAQAVGISRTTLRKYRALGHIKPVIIGYAVLYPLAEVKAWKARYAAGRAAFKG